MLLRGFCAFNEVVLKVRAKKEHLIGADIDQMVFTEISISKNEYRRKKNLDWSIKP